MADVYIGIVTWGWYLHSEAHCSRNTWF